MGVYKELAVDREGMSGLEKVDDVPVEDEDALYHIHIN